MTGEIDGEGGRIFPHSRWGGSYLLTFRRLGDGSKRAKDRDAKDQSHLLRFLMKTRLRATSDGALVSTICLCIPGICALRTMTPALYENYEEERLMPFIARKILSVGDAVVAETGGGGAQGGCACCAEGRSLWVRAQGGWRLLCRRGLEVEEELFEGVEGEEVYGVEPVEEVLGGGSFLVIVEGQRDGG